MTLNRRQFIGASAIVAGAIVMTPFGRAMADPIVLPPPVDVTDPGGVTGDDALDTFLLGLGAYVDGEALRRVVVKPGTYKRFKPVVVPSGVHLAAAGCTFILQTKGKQDCLVHVDNVTYVTIDGGVWDGNKKIVKAKTEWRHAIRLHNAKNVTLQHLRTQNAKGDGIYIGTDETPCENVFVDDVRCLKNARCGLAITACDGFLATNSSFYSNSGEAPEAGVVIEPHDFSRIENITFQGCRFFDNASRGFHVVMHQTSAYPIAEEVGIMVKDCSMTNNGKKSKDQSTAGIALLRPRKVTITNCTSSGNQSGVYILGRRTGDILPCTGVVTVSGGRVTGNRKDGVIIQNAIGSLIVQENCQIVKNSTKKKNTYDGLRIRQGSDVRVSGSTITGHRYGVYTDAGVSGVLLTGNVLTPNKKGATRGPGITVAPV